jgi:ubiquitin-conjugating enzyme E2 variant
MTAILALQLLACLFAADFLAGVFHWAEDTWLAPGRSAWLDRVIVEPNLEHHRRPGGIREGTYLQTNVVTIGLSCLVALALIVAGVHAWQVWLTIAIASQSNQFHAWAHTALPPLPIAWLQRIGLLQSAAHHAVHHKRPYGMRYCTTTPFLNPLLDGLGFWRALEWLGERLGARVVRATPARRGL